MTSYLIVDSGNNFANSVGSSLGTTFATISTTDTVLKASGSAAIVDGIPSPSKATLDLSSTTYSVTEGSSASIVINRTNSATPAVSVDLRTTDGTALQGTDFTFGTNPSTVNFPMSDTTETVMIPAPDRPGYQGDRTFTVSIENPLLGADAELGTTVSATVTIVEDDTNFGTVAYDAVQVAVPVTVTEGTGAGNSINLNLVRTGGTDGSIQVAFSQGAGATPGTDYTIDASPVTLAEGSAADTITITTIPNNTFQGDKTFTVTLTSATNAIAGNALGTPVVATVTILEDDAAPPNGTIQFSAPVYSGAEDGGTLAVTVTRENGSFGQVSADLSTMDGTAIAGTHYTGVSGQTVTFPDGNSDPQNILIPVTDNDLDEADRTFDVSLDNFQGGAIAGAITSATATILDDDVAGTIGFPSANVSVDENVPGGNLILTILRTGAPPSDLAGGVTVTVNTMDGTATDGTDYTGISGQVVTFAQGEASQQISIPIANDSDFTLDGRTFTVTISSPTGGATLGTATVTVAIQEDEVPVPGMIFFDPTTVSVAENAGTATLTLKRSGDDSEVTVDYATADGTALAGSDYTATADTATFPSGVTEIMVTVPITNDPTFENDETFTVTLSNPTNGASLGMADTATVTITNDGDQPTTHSLAASAFTVNEGSNVTVTVTRTGATDVATTVNYTTINGSAIAGFDYTANTGQLSFAANEISKTVTLATINDTKPEAPETFFFELSLVDPANPAVRLAPPTRAQITINRNAEGLDQPDALISQNGDQFVGNNVYSASSITLPEGTFQNPDGQIQVRNAGKGSTLTFKLRVQNDGPIPDTYRVLGVKTGTGAGGSDVEFRFQGEDVTDEVEHDDLFVGPLQPGEHEDVEVKIRLGSNIGDLKGVAGLVTVTSANSTDKKDAAMGLVIAVE